MSSIFKVVKAENEKILKALKRLEDATRRQPQERARLLGEVRGRIDRLQEAQDRFYPLLWSYAETRDRLTEYQQRNDAVQDALRRLEGVDCGAQEFQTIVEGLLGAYRRRIEHEDKQLLSAAASVVSEEHAKEIGSAVLAQYPELEPGAVAERAPGPRESLVSD